MKNNKQINHRKLAALLIIGLVLLSSIIPFRLAIALHQAPTPQAILVLEGSTDRIRFAAQFSKSHPQLPVWISGNPNGLSLNQSIFRQANVPDQQVHYEFCATDTVTNFTCNVDTFVTQKIQHIYVITSDYHMPRSLSIATFVLGSRGIFVTPVPIATGKRSESPLKIVRDCLRSIIWILTGYTGADLRRI